VDHTSEVDRRDVDALEAATDGSVLDADAVENVRNVLE
jgi:hypothetical protein